MLEEPMRLVAALDDAFHPPSLDHPANECMTSVMAGHQLTYETFVAGTSDFAHPKLEAGFDGDLSRTFAKRLQQLRDFADGAEEDDVVALARVLLERFGFDSTGFVGLNRRLIDSALDVDGGSITEAAALLEHATMNASYLRRIGKQDGETWRTLRQE
jgi:hypothetical protein